MKTKTVSFLDKTTIYYFGFKSLFQSYVASVNFIHERDLQEPVKPGMEPGDFICYHINIETSIAELRSTCKKIRVLFPETRLIGCFDMVKPKMIPLIRKDKFRGFIMMEDPLEEIVRVFDEISNGGAGLSKGFLKNYLTMKHKENIKINKKRKPKLKSAEISRKEIFPDELIQPGFPGPYNSTTATVIK
ncbi:MAG: hypothetical protein JNM19_01965 [Chitinophagaceae bacterium]|nr:hypothetical protein [Chitinophagaceae bacterium]